MMHSRLPSFFLLTVLACSLLSAAALPQPGSEPVEDPDGKFTLVLPNKGWQAIVSRDQNTNRPQLDIIYRVREDGSLDVKQVTVEPGLKTMDYAKKDEQTLSFQAPGYAKVSVETFGANAEGAVVTYDYTRGGRPMTGRRYYLRANDTTIFVLRFTGNRNTLGPLRSQTDAIARSFKAR
jgi:hypothetical protein